MRVWSRALPCDRLVVAERFAAMFAKDDSGFDRHRFLRRGRPGDAEDVRGVVDVLLGLPRPTSSASWPGLQA